MTIKLAYDSPIKELITALVEAKLENSYQIHLSSGDASDFDWQVERSILKLNIMRMIEVNLQESLVADLEKEKEFQL